jgi:transposase InsO family protein
METSLVKDALSMAWWRRRPPKGLIFHSDRGSQYCSHEFQKAIKDWDIRSSMCRKGNCWDTPPESRWGSLKRACVHWRRFATHQQAREAVMDWIAFYKSPQASSDVGLSQPHAVRTTLTGRAATRRRLTPGAMHSELRGQGQDVMPAFGVVLMRHGDQSDFDVNILPVGLRFRAPTP